MYYIRTTKYIRNKKRALSSFLNLYEVAPYLATFTERVSRITVTFT